MIGGGKQVTSPRHRLLRTLIFRNLEARVVEGSAGICRE